LVSTHDLSLSDPLKIVPAERTKLVTIKGKSQDPQEIAASVDPLSLRVNQRNPLLVYKMGTVFSLRYGLNRCI